ncbi:MAG: J domain-containing protein [Spirochaetia bacterium]
MDNFFDRLGDLLKSVINTPTETHGFRRSGDPDLDTAWEELDEYMRTGEESTPKRPGFNRKHREDGGRRYENDPTALLRKDFARLELPFGAPLTEVKQSYKKMLVRYHPDRWSADQEKMAVATEITKKINESFRRINEYYEK